MKKKFVVLLILCLSLLFTSCGEVDFEINAKFINANLDYLDEDKIEIALPKVLRIDLNDYKIVNIQYINKGIVLISDDESRLSAWNFFEEKILFPFKDYESLNIINSTYLGCYFKVVEDNNMTTIYDVNGNVVLPRDDYSIVEIKTIRESVYDEYLKFRNFNYFEELEYQLSNSDVRVYKKYKVDIKSKTREEVVSDSKNYDKKFYNKVDLKHFGLDGYFLVFIGQTAYVYNNKNELVNRLIINTANNALIFDGKCLIQSLHLTHEDSLKYDLLIENKKYMIETKSITILTGKEETLNLDYIISNGKTLIDEKGNANFGYATINKIVGKTKSNTDLNVIINSKGEVIYNLGSVDITSLVKLADDTYYCPIKQYLFNENLEPLFALRGIPEFVNCESKIILKEDSVYGAIDYEGNIVIPFKYNFISSFFYNGKTFATDQNGKHFIIDFNDYKKGLPVESAILTTGVVISLEKNTKEFKTIATIATYDGNLLASIEYLGHDSLLFQNIGNTYDNGIFTSFQNKYGKLEFILLKFEHKEK